MDLLASYGSSDEEDDRQGQQQHEHQEQTGFPKSTSIFSSLPRPKSSSSSSSSSSSLFSSLPQPKRSNDLETPSSSSKLFSTLPQPAAKRIVQFTPPIPPSKFFDDDDEDDDDDEKERKRRKESQSAAQAPSVHSFLSSIPVPRNSSTLGAALSSGSGRRSILETDATAAPPNLDDSNPAAVDAENGADGYVGYEVGPVGSYVFFFDKSVGSYVDGAYQESYPVAHDEAVGWNALATGDHDNNVYCPGDVGSYGDSSEFAPLGEARKRGRKEANVEIVEVKQDELMKNRPREDQLKLTGIAFGPSHKPASTKGKPSKLHKRKHQIGSLYFDMKQKEMELAERRARGLLTKAQTHGKYGW